MITPHEQETDTKRWNNTCFQQKNKTYQKHTKKNTTPNLQIIGNS